jgi:glucosamine--fructose-6-phosphate aminotransferase (isomerizing)
VNAPAAAIERLAAASEELLRDAQRSAERLAAWHAGASATVLLGRGSARAAAEMGALVLKESAGVFAESLDSAEFRHGPLELAGPGLACMLFVTEPAALELDTRLAAELAQAGASVLLVAPEAVAIAGVDSVATGVLEPLLAAAAAVHPAQLLAWRLALARGRTPGRLLRASKVTTRE